MGLEQLPVITTSGGDTVSTDTLRHLVRFAVSDGRSAEKSRVHPPSPSPPPLSLTDTSNSNSSAIKCKEAPASPIANESGSSSVSSLSPNRRALHSLHLRPQLTREQHDRDPLFFYEIVKTLGAGSMGSVVHVKKRVHAIGGSARKDMQDAVRRQKQKKKCLHIPIIGGIFRMCIDGDLKYSNTKNRSDALTLNYGGKFLPIGLSRSKETLSSSNGSVPTPPSLSRSASGSSLRSVESLTTSTGQPIEYAMKSIHLNRVADSSFLDELRNEVSILKQLDHPYIVKAIETFENRNQIFIIMELCSGGDLYSRDPYTEEDAARIVCSILSAIAYMHSRNILHRDLKFENVLFVNQSPTAEIKLIDYGLSRVYCDNTALTESVGTIYTMAPEVLHGDYTEKADVWSVGVVAYMLLSSRMPFYGRKRLHIVEQILNGQFDFRGRRWQRISSQAKAFVEELLVLDADERLDAQTAMSSVWLNRRFAATTRGPDAEEESMARHAMLRYAGYTKLKKMALMVVAHNSSSAEIGILRKVFQKYDKKRDGSIGYEDFCYALSEFGLSEPVLKGIFEAVDLDGTGRIRYTEFLAATIEAQGAISEERLAEAFDRLDTDDSGYISADNLAELLGHDFPREEIDEIIAEADLTDDHQISYADFLALWGDKHELKRIHNLNLLGSETLTRVLSDLEISAFVE